MANHKRRNSPNSEYQDTIAKWVTACGDMNDCDTCAHNAEGKCYLMHRVIDRKTARWWKSGIASVKAYERAEPIPPPSETPSIIEELFVTCINCRIQETITLEDWKMVGSRQKFIQDETSGYVAHRCSNELGEVVLTKTKETIDKYIARRKSENEKKG